MQLFFTVLFWMLQLAPGRDHAEAATAITKVVLDEPPLFKGDESRTKTAALVVAIAFRESSFRNEAKSKTNDHCLAQVHGRPELANNPELCIRVALTMIRESMRMCPEYPLAFYAEGPGGCNSKRAKRISNDRMAIAKGLRQ
jgi:hypothetical protein